MTVSQSLYWWTPAQLAELTCRFQPAWQRWLGDWIVAAAPDLVRVECTAAFEARSPGAGSWVALGARGSAAAWVRPISGSDAPWLPSLFGTGSIDSRVSTGEGIATAVATDAIAELVDTLRAALDLVEPGTPGPAPYLFKPWGGGITVSLGRDGPQVLLNPSLVDALLGGFARTESDGARLNNGRIGGLHSVVAAVADRPVQVRVVLAPCELDFGTLSGLRVGDTIPLPHSLDAPLFVSVGDDQLCTGFLGRQGSARAIELMRDFAVAEPTEPHH